MPVAPLTLEWQSNAFDRFTVNDLYDVMRLRMAVFIGEQQCWYQMPTASTRAAFTFWADCRPESWPAI